RGTGTAKALITCRLVDRGASTDVEVDTDLNVTGKPAQFGRGVIQDVSDKLLGQFVECLQQRLDAPEDTAQEPPADERPRPGVAVPGGDEPADELDLGATVLPILARTYWKQLLGAVLVLLVLRRLLGGRRG
ncbi:MAG: carbon monoxide dehydrogenase, partial [Actinomycetes bacterium]